MKILNESDSVTMFIDDAGDYYCAWHIAPGQSELYPLMLGPKENIDFDALAD